MTCIEWSFREFRNGCGVRRIESTVDERSKEFSLVCQVAFGWLRAPNANQRFAGVTDSVVQHSPTGYSDHSQWPPQPARLRPDLHPTKRSCSFRDRLRTSNRKYPMLRLAVLIALVAIRSAAWASSPPPNVLLIITDEHNFRTLGCYRALMPREQGHMWGINAVVPTPNIDRLANEGVICTRAYATAPVCTPSRAAMFTGRYPHATGAPKNDLKLDRSIPTLADRLNDFGYRTGYFGKWHLGGEGKPEWAPEIDGGFQFKKFMFNRGHWKKFAIANGKPMVAARRNGQPSYGVAGADERSFATDWLTDRTIDFVNDTDSEKPFFAVLSYPDPHGPNTVRAPYDHRFDDLPFSPPRTFQLAQRPTTPKWLGSKMKHDVFRGADMSLYFGMVQCIDDNVGRLIENLQESNRLDNTLVIMTSDHGDLCYEHDRTNKGNPYEGSARVPLILRHPRRIAEGEYYVDPVGTVDLTPTVLGLLELPGDGNMQGRDLSAELADASKRRTDPTNPPTTFLRAGGMLAHWVAAVDARYKLVLSVKDRPWLFDAGEEPDELNNFFDDASKKRVVARLGKALARYRDTTGDPALKLPAVAASLAEIVGGTNADTAAAIDRDKKKNRAQKKPANYASGWTGNRPWIGPDWWANPLTEWSISDGAATAKAAKNRTLCLLSHELSDHGDSFSASVQIDASLAAGEPASAAGFRIGRRGGIDDYRHALVHATKWMDAVIRRDGKVTIGESASTDRLRLSDGPVDLRLRGRRSGDTVQLSLAATQGDRTIRTSDTVPIADIKGGVALLSHGAGNRFQTKGRFAFRDFQLSGDMVRRHSNRTFGPIMWTQYSLSGDQLRLQAQFAPLNVDTESRAEFWTADDAGSEKWKRVADAPLDKLSRTATFTVEGWQSKTNHRYQVRFEWNGKRYFWDGRIRKEPTRDEPFKLGCFSCDNGYLFPIPAMVQQVKRQNPDMVFFAGDQIYESYGGFGVNKTKNTEAAMKDYLRKFYQFGWTWREVLRDRPCVILPDDHDVFQGNLWGHGGRKLPPGKMNEWARGGYEMPGDWVRAIERTNVGHLPDPAVDITLPIGIKPYFTSLTYGGIGFVILEDRKFKTGPLSVPDDARREGTGGNLLGQQQEDFLEKWSRDWREHKMKCALSQTIFCRAATHVGPDLRRSRGYYDSGAWPKAARNRVVRILGDCNALAIHGDQHLGVLLRHGVDEFDDAGFAFMVPGTANGFPRAWWPGINKGTPSADQSFTGKFQDEAGHPIHILAVGNPEPGSNRLPTTEDPMVIGYRKGSGYGMVEFNRKKKTAKISLYKLGDKEEMFPGFPQTINVGGEP